jgi:DNA-binding XRE family transcriptional regulator
LAAKGGICRQSVSWIGRRALDNVIVVDDDRRAAFKRAFASTLLGLRADRRVGSQRDFAKVIGTSEATYRRWENMDDPNMPDAWELSRLVAELHVEPDELVNPADLSPREREMARRLARGIRRGRARGAG